MVDSISIHALREEGDVAADVVILYRNRFLSTPSARRATVGGRLACDEETISIHALREEGDDLPERLHRPLLDFYPRPPRGGRRSYTPKEPKAPGISIHALREEGDAAVWVRPSKG